ncbi:hypothetical protein [Streptomyces pratensis]|uniref:hypothetical protein n=1 Tax=Streptomyces pratensis TaxID=1169025 RepID=UPI00301A4169
MSSSSLSQKQRHRVRAASLVAGLALAAVTFAPGTASAATGPADLPATPEHIARLVCTELSGLIGHLPAESGPVRVCKLVNGWD